MKDFKDTNAYKMLLKTLEETPVTNDATSDVKSDAVKLTNNIVNVDHVGIAMRAQSMLLQSHLTRTPKVSEQEQPMKSPKFK